jgi:hypothetical protein
MKNIKVLLLTVSIALTSNTFALQTNLMAAISPSHGKPGHNFESYSTHAYNIYNDDTVTHIYKWHIKQCPMYNGRPEVCPENEGGKLTLVPGQFFTFNRKLTMELKCGAAKQSIPTYAESTLEMDNPNGQYWVKKATSTATCE